MAVFEIQKLAGGRWVIDSLFDDRDLAIAEAKNIMSGTRPPAAIRIVEDGEGGVAGAARVVFRQSAIDEHNQMAMQRMIEARREAEAQRARRRADRSPYRGAVRPGHGRGAGRPLWHTLLVRLVVILALSYGAVEALRLWLL